MEYFSATFSNGTINEISTDGNSITIVDNSNYVAYSDLAQTGAAGSITLASTESNWNDFFNGAEIEIIAGTGIGQHRVITDYDGSTKVATVGVNWVTPPDGTSVYVIGEVGNIKSYFSDYRLLEITLPDNTTTTLIPPIISLPAVSTLPITDTYTFLTSADGVYSVRLASVPTWSATVAYKNITKPYVYYNGILYQNIADSLNDLPDVSATKWTALTSYTQLPTKYLYEAKIAVYCGIMTCYLSAEFIAETKMECWGCNSEQFMRDPFVQKAFKLKLAVDSIPVNASLGNWDKVTDTINFAKNICCSCGNY